MQTENTQPQGQKIYWSTVEEVIKAVERMGRVQCQSSECTFYMIGGPGCHLSNGTLIKGGRCLCYTTVPLKDICPDAVSEAAQGQDTVQDHPDTPR